MTFSEELGCEIRERRKAACLTQVELAELIGISDKTMRDIERGTPGPSFENVFKAARAVGIELRFS